MGKQLSIYSQLGVEEEGGKLTGAAADIVADLSLFAVLDALAERGVVTGEDTSDAGGEHDVLVGVLVVGQGGCLLGQVSDVAVGEHSVGSLGQVNVRKVELGQLVRSVEVDVVEDIEGAGDEASESTAALLVIGGGESVDESEADTLVVGSTGLNSGDGSISSIVSSRLIIFFRLLFKVVGCGASLVHGDHTLGGVLLVLSSDSVNVDAFSFEKSELLRGHVGLETARERWG